VELDTVVKWFILVIVLVFDPLSICLVLAYNFLVRRESAKAAPKTFAVYDEKPTPESPQAVQELVPEVQTEPSLPPTPPIDPDDPYPQYMTKAETDDVMERWWARRNGLIR
jgi:hypothetical protein